MVGSMPLDLLRSANGTGLRTAFSAAKLAFLLVGVASTVVLARLAVPLSRDLLLSALPRLSAAVGGYLSPSYIFVVVNFIILVILKLPDARGHVHRKDPPEGGDAAATTTPPKPTKDLPPSSPRGISSNVPAPAPASSSGIGDSSGFSGESCLTTDLEGDSAVSSTAAAPAGEEEEEDQDSMDATWKAITGRRQLKKNQTWSAPPRVQIGPGRELRKSETFREKPSPASMSPAAAATRRVVVDRRVNGREVPVVDEYDDVNRQFEAFIKKVNDQMRRPREESARRRYVDMVNSSGY
uniref:Ral guanine nucleotide dissociation stimulator-like 3 n=1 Tax=Anthurium amnicola TaxID=1678845 RepID=A0A1D1YN78_9ARAE